MFLPTVIGLVVALLVAMVATSKPTAAIEQAVGFKATLPTEVVGGQWMLSTYGGLDEDQPIGLGRGDVPATGTISVDVPLSVLAASTSQFFVLRVLLPLDHDHGIYASVSRGLLPDALVAGATIDLGTAIAQETLINEAAAAQPTTPEGTFDPGTIPQTGTTTIATPAIAVAPTKDGVPAATAPSVDPTQPQPAAVAPTQNCRYSWCSEDTLVPGKGPGGGTPQDHSPKCSSSWYGYNDCLTAYRDYVGVLAFRGDARRPIGAFNTFRVEFSNVQEWDVGVRVSGGPFRVDGHLMRQFTGSQEDAWPERGDCWQSNLPGDRNCTTATDATESKWGTDTWRWEKHAVWFCSGSYCNYSYEERVRERSYDGGNETPSPGEPGNSFWYEPPSMVEDQQVYGSFGRYYPGSSKRWTLGNEVTYSASATLSINPPQGWGSAEFSAAMTNKTLDKTTNEVSLRSDLPWMFRWLRYDGGPSAGSTEGWEREFWTCEWLPDWSGGSKCWDYGS